MADIYAQADEFRAALARYEQSAAGALTARYQVVLDTLKPLIAQMTAQIDDARANGETVSRSWLFRQERYKALMAQVESEIQRFAGAAGRTVTAAQAGAVDMAQNHTEALTASVSTSFNRLPNDAFENIVGNLGDGSPLSDILDKLPNEGKKAVSDALAKTVALGHNPRKAAREVEAATGISRDRALTICRTETLRAYRQTAIQSYQQNSDVVSGWRWLAALGPRSCAMCIAMHGTVHPNTEHFGSHVNCRCCPSPVVAGSEIEPFETGAQWFAKQSAAAQDAILGSWAGGEAYRAGAVGLNDFAGERADKKWGLTRFARSLTGALHARPRAFAPGEDAAENAAENTAQNQTNVPATRKKAAKGQSGKEWRVGLEELLAKRADFGVWGDLLPEESRTALFASERTKRMLEHLLEIGNVVQDEAERRLKVATSEAGFTKSQVSQDSQFLKFGYEGKLVGIQRIVDARAKEIAKSVFHLDLDEIIKDEEKYAELQKLLEANPKYQKAQEDRKKWDDEKIVVEKRVALKLTLRRQIYGDVLREVRAFGLNSNEHAFTWAEGTNSEAVQAADEAARFFPSDWLKKSRDIGSVKVEFTKRAEYKVAENGLPAEFLLSHSPPRDASAFVGDSDTLSNALHEFGHRFEDIYPEVRVFEALYYRKRTERNGVQEEPVPTQPPEVNRIKGEIVFARTRIDKFVNQYIGKDMGNSYDSLYELLTMGMEGIFIDKYNMHEGDEEMCRFILGLLTGV